MVCNGLCRLHDRRRGAAMGQRRTAGRQTGGQRAEYGAHLAEFWRRFRHGVLLSGHCPGTEWGELPAVRFAVLQAHQNAGPLTALTATPGFWNNWHAGGGTIVDSVDPHFWYESDLIFTLAATLWENVTIGLTYTAYTGPNDSFKTVQELAFSLSLNDSKWLGAFALNPSLLVAGEVAGQADAGSARGVYLQLGINPGYTLAGVKK